MSKNKMFLHHLACCISHNLNDLESEIDEITFLLSEYLKLALAYDNLDRFQKVCQCYQEQLKQPETLKIRSLKKEMQKNLPDKNVLSFFENNNYLNIKEEIEKAVQNNKNIVAMIYEILRNLESLRYGLKRIASEENYEGKIVILKGMLIYY